MRNCSEAWIEEDEEEGSEDNFQRENDQESRSINSKRKPLREITEEEVNEGEESEEETIQIKPSKKIKTENYEISNKNVNKKSNKKDRKETNKNDLQQANNEEFFEEMLPENEEIFYEKENNNKKNKKRFSYVDAGIIDEIREDLRDNTFEAKYKYGEGDEFGKFGNERLKEVKGRDFKKEKAKLKNKQFHGGGGRIDAFAKSSVKLNFEE